MRHFYTISLVALALATTLSCSSADSDSNDGSTTQRDIVLIDHIYFKISDLTIESGSTVEPTLVFSPANASNRRYSLTSNNQNSILVTEDGVKIVGVESGEATITATTTTQKLTATCKVTVTPMNP